MSGKRRNRFANGIILLCVVMGIVITFAVLWGYHRLDMVLPAEVIGKLFLFWGGELLIVALRQIFGSDAVRKKKDTSSDEESI